MSVQLTVEIARSALVAKRKLVTSIAYTVISFGQSSKTKARGWIEGSGSTMCTTTMNISNSTWTTSLNAGKITTVPMLTDIHSFRFAYSGLSVCLK